MASKKTPKSTMNMMADALAPVKDKTKVSEELQDGAADAAKAAEGDGFAKPEGSTETLAPAAATPTKPAKPTGPQPIKTKNDLLKAVWSSRGNVYAPVAGVPGLKLAIVKSSLTDLLKTQDLATAAPFNLVARAPADGGGSDLIPMAADEAA